MSCAAPGRFQTLKDKGLWSQFGSLQEARRTKTKKDFSLLQQAAGLNYHPKSILADLELRPYLPPISITNMDWMHNFLVNGVVSNELHAFLARCKDKLGVRFQELHRFATADWRWPSAQRTHSALQFLAKGGGCKRAIRPPQILVKGASFKKASPRKSFEPYCPS